MLHREFDALFVESQSEISRAFRGMEDIEPPPNSHTPARREFDTAIMETIILSMAEHVEQRRRQVRSAARRAQRASRHRPREIMDKFRRGAAHGQAEAWP